MFNAGQTVIYGSNGVCKIIEITTKKISGSMIEYYVLKPLYSDASTLFVPVQNNRLISKIRGVMTAKEINDVIENLPEIGEWNDNKLERSDAFRAALSSGVFSDVIGIIRLIRRHEQEQVSKGRHLHLADDRILKEAEKIVYEEISYALGIDRQSAADLVLK